MPLSYPAEDSQQTFGNVGLELSLQAKSLGSTVIIKGMATNSTSTTLWEERGKVKENPLGKIFLVNEEEVVNKE